VTHKRNRKGACWNLEEKRDRDHLELLGHGWEDNIRIDFQEVE
jgi:hypothetical protein